MLLYQDPTAVNPRRVRIFFAEKGLDFDTIDVAIAEQAQRSPAYLAKHPLGLLPVLELSDGRVLRESVAICRYVEELYPTPNLFGTDAWNRAKIEQWNRHAEFELLLPIVTFFRHTHSFWRDRIPQVPQLGEVMRDIIDGRMIWFDEELGSREYLASAEFSIADITLRCALDFGRIVKVRIPDTLKNLTRWYEQMSLRPSVIAETPKRN